MSDPSNGKLVVNMFQTMDGVMQAPGGPEEDTECGFKFGGWQAPYFSNEGELIGKDLDRMKALLLGRKTYDIFAAYWPNTKTDLDVAAKLNSVPKYVASRTLKKVEWNNSTLLKADIPTEIARIKRQHGEVHLIGSGNFLQTLLKNDLVDVFNLFVYPLLLGKGKKTFADGTIPAALKLAESKTFDKGAVLLRYERAGKPAVGTMGA